MKALEDLVSPLAKRLSNSIVSSYLITWTFINWKFIFTLVFSSGTVKNRIIESEAYLSNHYYSWGIPLIMTLFYVIVLPILDSIITGINAFSIMRDNKTNFKIKRASIFQDIEIARNEKELNDVRSGYAEVKTLNQEIESLRLFIEQKDKIIDENNQALILSQNLYKDTHQQLETLQNNKQIERNEAQILAETTLGHMQGLYYHASKEASELKEQLLQYQKEN